MRPLRGVRVLEFAPHYPGQYLGRLLRHLGASVTKVESPQGDSNRRIGPFLQSDVGFLFAASNAGKSIRRVDLRTMRGRRSIGDLLRRADIVVQAFRPGTAKRLGIDWAACRAANPRVVYVEISGWGTKGPWSLRHGHDLAYQAASGMLDPVHPSFPNVGTADLFGTFWAGMVALSALREADRTGKGRRIPVSIAGSSLAASQLSRAAASTRDGPPRFMRGGDPFYQLYRCRDGRFLALAIVEPPAKARALEVLGVRGSVGHASVAGLARAFARRGRDVWVRRLAEADVPCAPVRSAKEAPFFFRDVGAFLPPLDLLGGRRGSRSS